MALDRVSGSEIQLAIHLSSEELWFLLSQFGPAVILGMENPYLGWLANEIEAAHKAALKSLVDRDLVRMVSKDEIALDETLATMVAACAQADHSLIVQRQRADGAGQRSHVHFANGLIVEHQETEPGRHRLMAVRDRQALTDLLAIVLQSDSRAADEGESFDIAEQVLFEARDLCSQGHAQRAVALLVSRGLNDEMAAQLTKVLASPTASSSVVVLVNRAEAETQHVRGFAVLEGQHRMWIVRSHDGNGHDQVEFVPANATTIQARFFDILP